MLVLLIFVIGLVSFPQWGETQDIEAAKREGKVVWYTSMGVDDSQLFAKAFSKNYPDIRVHVVRASSEKLLNRILTEARTGKYLFDVVTLGGFEIHSAQKHGLLGKYVSPESVVYKDGFKDPEGYWTDIWDTYYVIGYNTKKVTKEEAPRSWEDLLAPKWIGKFAMEEEGYEWYAGMLQAMGEEKGKAFMHALARQDIRWRRGLNLMAQLLVTGELSLAMSYAHGIDQKKKKGAPVEWVTTTDPVIVALHPMGIGAKADHPDAAKLFIDFALSREGQSLIQSFARTPARPDLDFSASQVDLSKLALFPIPPSAAENYQEYVEEYRRIFSRKKMKR